MNIPMKSKFFILVALVTSLSFAAQAQLKVGYTNIDLIVSQLPETRAAENEFNSFETKLGQQFQAKQQEFQAKQQTAEQTASTLTEEQLVALQTELETMYNSLQQFQAEAQQSLSRKRNELLQPAYDKAQKAIEDVAKENGYTYVFSDGNGAILLVAPEQDNITNLVFAKLGITPPAEGEENESSIIDNN